MENFIKNYSKIIVDLIFKLILTISNILFNLKWIQKIVDKLNDEYSPKVGKSVGIALELLIVTGFYLGAGFIINKLGGTDNGYWLLVLQPLQLILNKYQRQLDDDLKDLLK